MSKISELSDGGSLLPTDDLVAVRSGANVKVKADNITVDRIDLGDNEKIRLGDSQDLQIYHDGSNSRISDQGAGNLIINAGEFRVNTANDAEAIIKGDTDGAVKLYYDGSQKLATTSTGIDVTGTIVGDGLTVDGGAANNDSSAVAGKFNANGNEHIRLEISTDSTIGNQAALDLISNSNTSRIFTTGSTGLRFSTDGGSTSHLVIDGSGRVGIGTTSPSSELHVKSSGTSSDTLTIENSTGNGSWRVKEGGGSNALLQGYNASNSETIRLDPTSDTFFNNGNVGIGTSSPSALLELSSTTTAPILRLSNEADVIAAGADLGSIEFYSGDDSGGGNAVKASISAEQNATSPVSADLTFQTAHSSGSLTEYMRITSLGNVGIGTTSPTMPLSVQAASNAYAISMHGRSDGYSELYGASNDGSTKYSFLQSHSTQTKLYTLVNTPLLFGTNSTERMRIDSSGNVGIGTSSPSARLESSVARTSGANATALILSDDVTGVQTTGFGTQIRGVSNGGSAISAIGFEAYGGSNNDTAIAFYTQPVAGGLARRMTINDDGNVGIGTATPNDKVDIYGSTGDGYRLTDGTHIGVYRSISGGTILKTTSNHALLFGTNDTERMRIDSSGQVGIGTSSPDGIFHAKSASSVHRSRFESGSSHSFVRIIGSTGSNAGLEFYSGSGNVGNITADGSSNLLFEPGGTEKMRLDSSGNLLVGKTSASSAVHGGEIRATGQVVASVDGSWVGLFNRETDDGEIIRLKKDDTTVGSIGTNSGLFIGSTYGNDAGIRFASDIIAPATTTGANRDAAIDLGYSSSRFKDLYLSGKAQADTYQFAQNSSATGATEAIYRPTTGQIAFKTNSSEAMRIDSSGNLLVGTTSSHGKLAIGDFSATGADYGVAFVDGSDIYFVRSSTTISTNNAHYEFYNPNGKVGSITTSGSATAYNTSSDQRLKDNIVDAPSASDDIDAIQVRSFDWKADGSHQKYGMVAQELVTVAPNAVSQPEDPEEMMGVDYSKLVPMLVKEVQQLRARVAQLEGEN